MFWLSCDPNQSKTPLPVLTACALVVQLDRIPDYESGGRRFESFRARSFLFRIFAIKRCHSPYDCWM